MGRRGGSRAAGMAVGAARTGAEEEEWRWDESESKVDD